MVDINIRDIADLTVCIIPLPGEPVPLNNGRVGVGSINFRGRNFVSAFKTVCSGVGRITVYTRRVNNV